MSEPDFLLELLIIALDTPTQLRQVDQTRERDVLRKTSRWIARISTSRLSGKLSRRPINSTLNPAVIPVRNYEFATHSFAAVHRFQKSAPPNAASSTGNLDTTN
jgi:hypothetical protein